MRKIGKTVPKFRSTDRNAADSSVQKLESHPRHQTLQAPEAHYRRLFEGSTDGILVLDSASGTVTGLNPALLEMLGYSREECLGKKLWDIGAFKNVREFQAEFHELQKKEYVRYNDLPLQTSDGKLIRVEFTSSAYQLDGRRVIQCNLRDNTCRKTAGQSRELLADIVEFSADAIIGKRLDGTIISWNRSAEALYGYTREEALGRNISIIVPEDHAGELEELYRRVERGEIVLPHDTVRQRRDGKRVDVSITASPIRDAAGQVTGVSVTARDITRLKQAEEARARLALAVEHTAESVVITETDGSIQYVNPAFERITGYRREEAVGQTPRMLNSGKQAPEFYRALWETLKRGKTWTGVFINKRKDGTLYEAEAVISPVRDQDGRTINYVGVERDVTRERQLEEQLRQSQKMEAIGQLAGGIAHDFNNLLTIIRGYSQLLFEDLAADDPRKLKIVEINNAADRAVSLTQQLLAFGRRQVLVSEVTDLNEVLTSTENKLRRLIGEDIELVIVQGKGPGCVRVDRGQIEQVIMNLVANARDAMPQGGRVTLEVSNIVLDASHAAVHPEIKLGPYVMLAVRDTGPGITPEITEHLFEPFFTTKEKGKGTGLGLSTVYGIVRQSEGCVCASSEPGQGAVFTVCLPQVRQQAAPRKQQAKGARAPRSGYETILLVEDEEALRSLVKDVLEGLGYTILAASRADEAIALCKQHPAPIPLLLTDVVMPGMSGRELADHLKFLYPGMKMLYMSGYTDDSLLRRGVLGPEAAFLSKPFTPQAIACKVREVLDRPADPVK